MMSKLPLSQTDISEFKSIMRAAGEMLKSRDTGHVSEKPGGANFVTERDVAIERFLKRELARIAPEAGFLGEEGGGANAPVMFIIDPIDGTTNYIRDYRASAVSAALITGGEAALGAVYNPYQDELFFAQKGKGAYLNDKRLSVAARSDLSCVIAVGTSPYNRDTLAEPTMKLALEILKQAGDLRRSGSAALDMCAVACGRADAFVELRLSPWDHAAAALIVAEAGGIASQTDGAPLDLRAPAPVLLATPAIYPKLLAICQSVLYR